MTNPQKWKRFAALREEIEAYERCLGKVQFDMECCAPEEGLEQASEDIAILSRRLFALTHAKAYLRLLCELHEDPEGLTPRQKKAVSYFYEDYAKTKNISAKLDYDMTLAATRAYGDWLSAKKASDFSLFRDSFAAQIGYTRQAIDLRDGPRTGSYYDVCLSDFEKGGSEKQLDAFFAALRERIVPLRRRILREGKPVRSDFLTRPVPVARQEAASRCLLELEGLRPTALVLMTTEHPFTDHYGRNDVRVTTHYYENNFISNIFSTLHEGGHALFMQNEPADFFADHMADRMSCAMHECISRFYENIIGRSEAFIRFFAPKLRELSGGVFADVSDRELYEAVNLVRPGLIRMESDELSYCLHIYVRYELEKAFVNGTIGVDEIPARWNALYREILDVEVPDDARGCLQDVHWTGGYGYFPSYALGNAYGAQILHTMRKDFDVDAAIAAGELTRIRDWLTEHVFSIASLSTPDEWIRAVTGEGLNVNYFLDYLGEKFKTIYDLK